MSAWRSRRVVKFVANLPLVFAGVEGDRIFHVISGSGGHGDPWEREPDKVLADIKAEKVTRAGAREQYGVVIDPHSLSVDWAATMKLRHSGQKPEPLVAAD